jgi:outer membrane biosynthesis protein TonB
MSYQFGHVDPDERLDHAEEPAEEAYLPPRRSLSGPALAIGAMAVFAGGLWFAYHEGTKHAVVTAGAPADAVPLIRADPQPVKVKPDKVGGMDIPDKDNPLYGAKTNAPVEKILPPPEPPAPRPPPPPPVQAQLPPPPTAAPPTAVPPVAATPAPQPQPAPPKPGETAVADGVRVQLASLRTPEAARDEWARLKRENPDLLGKLTAVAVRADMGDKGIYYRIEAGPLPTKAAAGALCGELKQRDLGCQLVR